MLVLKNSSLRSSYPQETKSLTVEVLHSELEQLEQLEQELEQEDRRQALNIG
jgi:hypothetical protein